MNENTLEQLKQFETLDEILATDILPEEAKELLNKTDNTKSDIDRVCSVIVKLLNK